MIYQGAIDRIQQVFFSPDFRFILSYRFTIHTLMRISYYVYVMYVIA